ncbi:MAG: hypothetical protein H8E14_10335 [Candidatus Marinimicrobia bacterium]|nr:hypothetical protein [Candidatus Neomarinimicrobiota bacterium]
MEIKEILVLHHSHLDVGYTHSQPILWELQREFINQALDLLDQTAEWSEESQPRWTCEVTAQVAKWLESATPDKVEHFTRYLKSGRIGISAMEYNTTPLNNAEELIRHLYLAQKYRDRFKIPIRTINQHDVNGMPWTLVDLMVDNGIELLIMAVNSHFGHTILNRPNIFRWTGPSGRAVLVMNGAHYTMFDQILQTPKNDLNAMRSGLEEYLIHLDKLSYPHDFIYLTTAHAPVSYDNSSPNPDVAKLIRQWNDNDNTPLIRYVTPDILLSKIKTIPKKSLPVYRGDWTDYWNFGCASTAIETVLNQGTKARLYTADMLNSQRRLPEPITENVLARAWKNVLRFNEHTWGAFNSLEPAHPQVRTQSLLKETLAHQGRELAEYSLIHELEHLADNPASAFTQDGILLVNTSPVEKNEFITIPKDWRLIGKRHRTARFTYAQRYDELKSAPLFGPVKLPPYSWKFVEFDGLELAKPQPSLASSEVLPEDLEDDWINSKGPSLRSPVNSIESKFYRLEYNPRSGRIMRLYDKTYQREVLDTDSEWTFFQMVHEYPDPMVDNDRKGIYNRSMEQEKYDQSCWNRKWKSLHQGMDEFSGYRIEKTARGITLVLKFKASGIKYIEQRITLLSTLPQIELEAEFYLEDVTSPEAYYFAFPLLLDSGWHCHFDTAGMPVELDLDQLPGVSNSWVTVESYAAVHNKDYCYKLFCPDAPLIQVGGFNFATRKKRIPREENPLLLAWPINNYWDTNFKVSQPGHISLRYVFSTCDTFNPAQLFAEGRAVAIPLEIHPAINKPSTNDNRFFQLEGNGLHLMHAKQSMNGEGIIVRIANLSDVPVIGKISTPGKTIASVSLTSPTEKDQNKINLSNGILKYQFQPKRIINLRLKYK